MLKCQNNHGENVSGSRTDSMVGGQGEHRFISSRETAKEVAFQQSPEDEGKSAHMGKAGQTEGPVCADRRDESPREVPLQGPIHGPRGARGLCRE